MQSKLALYIKDFLSSYTEKLNVWNSPDVDTLLRESHDKGLEDTSVTNVFAWEGESNQVKHIHLKAREQHMPVKFLPNCSRFEAELAPLNWIAGLFGISLRGNNGCIKLVNWKNTKANKYLFSAFSHLGNLRDKGEMDEYWRFGWELMANDIYLAASFNYVNAGWYKDLDANTVEKILAEVRMLVKTQSTDLKFSRVYIDKDVSKGTKRPLGVPTRAWRVYTHMINNLIVWMRREREGRQHAYFPRMGVPTAWAEVFKEKDAPFIYEFDLKGFFDNVDLKFIEKTCIEHFQMPVKQAEWFTKLNRSLVKLKGVGEDELFEADRNVALDPNFKINPQHQVPYRKTHEYVLQSNGRWVMEPVNEKTSWLPYHNLDDSYDGWEEAYLKQQGVPQGAATSCSGSTLALHHITDPVLLNSELGHERAKVVMYADDGLVFLEKEDDLADVMALFDRTGVSINQEKSGWVKRGGEWVKDLKFLGLLYSGTTKRIRAATRKGSTLEYGKIEQFLSYLNRHHEKGAGSIDKVSSMYLDSWDKFKGMPVKSWIHAELEEFCKIQNPEGLLFSGKLSGWFLSSMYSDSWQNRRPSNTLLLTSKRNSWVASLWAQYSMSIRRDYPVQLLTARLKTEMEKVERNFVGELDWEGTIFESKGRFNWNQFLFPDESKEAPIRKPKLFLGPLTRSLEEFRGDPELAKLMEVNDALGYYTKVEAKSNDPQALGPYSECPAQTVEPNYALLVAQADDAYVNNQWVGTENLDWDAAATIQSEGRPVVRYSSEDLPPSESRVDDTTKWAEVAKHSRVLAETMDLNVYNASSYACHSLLGYLENPATWSSKCMSKKDRANTQEMKFVRPRYYMQVKPLTILDKEVLWSIVLPGKMTKLVAEVSKNFKSNFLHDPQDDKSRFPSYWEWLPEVVSETVRKVALIPKARLELKPAKEYLPSVVKSAHRDLQMHRIGLGYRKLHTEARGPDQGRRSRKSFPAVPVRGPTEGIDRKIKQMERFWGTLLWLTLVWELCSGYWAIRLQLSQVRSPKPQDLGTEVPIPVEMNHESFLPWMILMILGVALILKILANQDPSLPPGVNAPTLQVNGVPYDGLWPVSPNTLTNVQEDLIVQAQRANRVITDLL